GGFDAAALARAIGAPEAIGRAKITGLRQAFAADPAVAACGGPRAALGGSLRADAPPPDWQPAHWAGLVATLAPRASPWWLRPGPLLAGAAALVLALAWLRPAPPRPEPAPAPVAAPMPEPAKVVAVPVPPPPPVAP